MKNLLWCILITTHILTIQAASPKNAELPKEIESEESMMERQPEAIIYRITRKKESTTRHEYKTENNFLYNLENQDFQAGTAKFKMITNHCAVDHCYTGVITNLSTNPSLSDDLARGVLRYLIRTIKEDLTESGCTQITGLIELPSDV